MSDKTDLTAAIAPGSPGAAEKGCTCPQIDNHYGKGYHGQPGVFMMAGECPLHGPGDLVPAGRPAYVAGGNGAAVRGA